MKRFLSFVLPGLKTYWAACRGLGRYRPRHFRPLRGLFAKAPLLSDRPAAEIDSINERSRLYFEQVESREFWLNRPFSDRPADPSFLWRFGLLVSALGLQPGQSVLDFGCGTGWTSLMLARMGADVVGMDVAPAALAVARVAAEREPRFAPDGGVRFVEYAGGHIEAEDGEFDHVFVFDAFHHLPHPRKAIEEFYRVLSPHGRFAFAEPGIGHAHTESSHEERSRGVLEEDVDVESLYLTARDVGFRGMDVILPPLPPEILTLPFSRLKLYLRGLTWLVPPDFLRKEILAGPMGVIRKGPYAITSLSPRAQKAKIRATASVIESAAGENVVVLVDVTNVAETVWLREGRHGRGYVRLGAQLLSGNGGTLERDYARAELPRDVLEGETVRVRLEVRAPPSEGVYRLRLDMVNEGRCWFSDKGSTACEMGFAVRYKSDSGRERGGQIPSAR